MKIEAKFKETLIELMKSMPIDEISVTVLCKRCGCHRQTFYYHYTDMYDLIADILLTEQVPGFNEAKDVEEAMRAFLDYAVKSFPFYMTTFSSSAKDLPDGFFYDKFHMKFLQIFSDNKKQYGIKKIASARSASRRFARMVSDEFGDSFKEPSMTPAKFRKKIDKFISQSVEILLPAVIQMSIAEEEKHD